MGYILYSVIMKTVFYFIVESFGLLLTNLRSKYKQHLLG